MDGIIYTLNVKCMAGKYYNGAVCERVLEIINSSSLHDLHLIIQDVIGFDKKHLYCFYGGRYPYYKDLLIDKEKYEHFISYSSSKRKLNEVYPLVLSGFMLYYLFDFKDRWIFELTKTKQFKQEMPEICYPRKIPEGLGSNLIQYPNTG